MDNITHIALSTIYDVLSGATTIDENMKSHLNECLQCTADKRWLESLVGFGDREKRSEPPDWAVLNAVNLFQLKRPSVVRFAREVVAALVYDSFNEPAPVGVRCRDLPARQTLYRVEGMELDLKIQLGAGNDGVIIGQIVSETDSTAPLGLRVELSQQGKPVRFAATNQWGEFVFGGLPLGNYEIQLSFPDKLVKVPSLSLDK